jgi:excisionase family DNA binding protein
MPEDGPSLLTTGQAAKLCSVTPDAVLKWIKKGRLRGERTAGGHFRIRRRDLDPFIIGPCGAPKPDDAGAVCSPSLHCWEFLSGAGEVSAECRQCVVHRVRASRCFLMAGLDSDIGHARQYCKGSCEDCVYYRWIQGLATKVLVISDDDHLIEQLESGPNDRVTLKTARNAYEASAMIEDFTAAFVVIDRDVLETGDKGLPDYLSSDPRLPGVKLLLAVPRGASGAPEMTTAHQLMRGVIEKPFDLRTLSMKVAETELKSRRGQHVASRV